MAKTILVPVDGSDHSRKALEFACDLAKGQGGELRLLHVPQSPHKDTTLAFGGGSVALHASREELEKAGAKVLEAAKRAAQERGCDVAGADVAPGDPAQAILDQAQEHGADMIVMGSRGVSDLAGLLLGSVSHKVNHLAPCTCITVR